MKNIFFLIFLFIIPIASIAQQDEIDNLFDDGGLSEAKNLAKIDISSTLFGDLSFFYERTLSGTITVEIGTGIEIPPLINFTLINGSNFSVYQITSGYSISIMPRIYNDRRAPENIYIGLQYKYRYYNVIDNNHLSYSEYMFVYGNQLSLYKSLYLDYNMGGGFRLISTSNSNLTPINFEDIIAVSMSAKLCYMF